MDFHSRITKLYHNEKKRWVLLVGLVAITHIMFQFLLLPYGNALRSLLSDEMSPGQSSVKTVMVGNHPGSTVKGLIEDDSVTAGAEKDSIVSTLDGLTEDDSKVEGREISEVANNTIDLVVDQNINTDSVLDNGDDLDEVIEPEILEGRENSSGFKLKTETMVIPIVKNHTLVKCNGCFTPIKQNTWTNQTVLLTKESSSLNTFLKSPQIVSREVTPLQNNTNDGNSISNANSFVTKSSFTNSTHNKSATSSNLRKKRMKCEMPPKSITTIDEMNRIFVRHHRSSRAMKPRWSSKRDNEVLTAKSQIENAPIVMDNQELYAPVFRNVSTFKRSYELMERTLKVYIYKDGNKPIFHLPILKGLYASEGWFMKLMEGNKRFVVKDPRKAHLFYMPFSSRMLATTLYVPNSHNRTNLRQYLKDYAEKIAAKYPYWNRTGGSDHFLVACHDWAPYETRHHMEYCIKALCNADVTAGFKIGRDISLPETYVRSARNPLRDLGGKPPSRRHILAFYAGNMHGYLRPILLKHWKDKDPDMKIFGPMPPGVASKMNYIQHMKSSKYCLCPKGYEVNSPRVVESIFYECVPVIISDNFVPPFFEVLDWGVFSIILGEKDIPNLKDILVSIPEKKYIEMQRGVRSVQRHFVWHAKPEKYDLFHMTLHSIWYNRVHQIKLR